MVKCHRWCKPEYIYECILKDHSKLPVDISILQNFELSSIVYWAEKCREIMEIMSFSNRKDQHGTREMVQEEFFIAMRVSDHCCCRWCIGIRRFSWGLTLSVFCRQDTTHWRKILRVWRVYTCGMGGIALTVIVSVASLLLVDDSASSRNNVNFDIDYGMCVHLHWVNVCSCSMVHLSFCTSDVNLLFGFSWCQVWFSSNYMKEISLLKFVCWHRLLCAESQVMKRKIDLSDLHKLLETLM